jgi:hypothetical protein
VNSTLVSSGSSAVRPTHLGCEEVDVGRLGGPAVDRGDLDAVRLGGRAHAVVVLADRERRPVRREHQADDPAEPGRHHVGDGLFDHRRRVLQAEHHVVPAGFDGIERGLQRVALGVGARRERREHVAAGRCDGLVAGHQFGQLLVGRRATATDVGVVGEDVVAGARRAVRHEHHGGVRGRAHGCTPSAVRARARGGGHLVEHVGIAVGLHPVAEVEHVARVAGVVGEHGVGAGQRDLGAGQHQRGVEVALHHEVRRPGADGRR